MTNPKRRILFVINRKSGIKRGRDWEKEIRNFTGLEDFEPEFFFLSGGDDSGRLKKKLEQFRPERVVAAGGDGTVTFVAGEVMSKPIDLAILPAGSANGTAAEIGLPAKPQQALELAINGKAIATDVIRLNDQYLCLHLSDVGINAQIVKYFEEGPWRGMAGYGLALLKALVKKSRVRVHIESPQNDTYKDAMMVIIANASKYGTGATINPSGDIHDGLFEVVIVRKLGPSEILKMFFHFKRFDPKKIEVFKARSVKIEAKHKMHFQVDGEYLGKVKEVKAQILAGCLRLVGPPEE